MLISRPIRAVFITFACLVALISTSTVVIQAINPGINPMRVFAFGSACCFGVSVFLVGLMLAGLRWFQLWSLVNGLPSAGLFGFYIWLALEPSADVVFPLLPWIMYALVALVAISALTGLTIASMGWARYFLRQA